MIDRNQAGGQNVYPDNEGDVMARRRMQLKGNLYQDGNWWRVRWWDDARTAKGTIERVRRSSIVGPAKGPASLSKKQAQKKAWEDILSHVNATALAPGSMMTLEQFITQKFEPEVVWTLKFSGKEHYKWVFKKILPRLGGTQLRNLTAEAIQKLVRDMADEKYSVQSLVHVRNGLHAVIKHAKMTGHFSGENPASMVRLPQMVRKQKYSLTWDQAVEALELLTAPYREMALMSMTTSLRVAEMTGLRRKDVNLTDAFVVSDGDTIPPWSFIVRRNWYRNREVPSTKTQASRRIQPVPKPLRRSLSVLLQEAAFKNPDDPIFVSRNGTPVDAHNANKRILKPVGKKIGVPGLSWHIFRHSAATFSDQVGMSKADRIALMGHSESAMTDYYTHSDIERRREYVDKIAEKLTEKEKKEVAELERMVGL